MLLRPQDPLLQERLVTKVVVNNKSLVATNKISHVAVRPSRPPERNWEAMAARWMQTGRTLPNHKMARVGRRPPTTKQSSSEQLARRLTAPEP